MTTEDNNNAEHGGYVENILDEGFMQYFSDIFEIAHKRSIWLGNKRYASKSNSWKANVPFVIQSELNGFN